VSQIQEFASSAWPCQAPAAMVSTIVAPATMAVRRSSAAVATINGATMNSELTIRPDIAANTQGKSGHETATATAICPAGGRVFTPAHPLTPDSCASPLHFTEFSARSGHAAALATGGTLHARLRSRGHAPRRPPAPAGRPQCRGHRRGAECGAPDAERDKSQLHDKCCCKLQPETSVS